MFVYHHAVREFIDCILDTETFGDITKIDVCFDINPTDARFHGILDRNDNRRGVVGDLCRYCAVLGLLIFQRSGRKAISVQINGIERDQDDLPIHVVCDVIFEGVSHYCVFYMISNKLYVSNIVSNTIRAHH